MDLWCNNLLEKNWIKGRIVNWLKDFLEKRKIKVRYEGHVTETVDTLNGCPQGSVISPIIFSLLMNSLQETNEDHYQKEGNILDNIQLLRFVDDGAICTESKCPRLAFKKAQKALNTIEKWSEDNGFLVNPSKTQVLMFQLQSKLSTSEQNPDFSKLKLGTDILQYKAYATFLGLTFDKYLKLHIHIDDLMKRTEKVIKKSLYNMYQSLIKSKLNYGSMVYNAASDGVLEKLQKLQNKALRVILSCPKYTPVICLIAESGELPLCLQRELNMLKYWTKSIGHGTNLPINEKIEEVPVFTLNPKRVKSVKDPYSQQIQIFTSKYRLSNSNIAPPCHEELFHFQEPKIDLELSNLISKKMTQLIT